MDVKYNPETSGLTIVFEPRDIRNYAVLMELVCEDTWKRKMYVPNFPEDFFKKFSVVNRKVAINFNFGHLEFCATFLDAVYWEMLNAHEDTSEIGLALYEIECHCADNSVLH